MQTHTTADADADASGSGSGSDSNRAKVICCFLFLFCCFHREMGFKSAGRKRAAVRLCAPAAMRTIFEQIRSQKKRCQAVNLALAGAKHLAYE